MAGIWADRAVSLLEEAIGLIARNEDAIGTVSAALAALRIEAGELPADELDGYPFPGEAIAEPCTCPPELARRGGYTSSCRAAHDQAVT